MRRRRRAPSRRTRAGTLPARLAGLGRGAVAAGRRRARRLRRGVRVRFGALARRATRLRRRRPGLRRLGLPRWRMVALGAAVVFGIGALARLAPVARDLIRDHPYFAVREIVVSPTRTVRAGALLERAGLQAGVSLWRVDPEALAARLGAHPWIRRARVRREFPRRLVIDLVERRAAAVLLLDQLYYVDPDGAVFVRPGPDEPLDLPFVTGVEAALVNGERAYARGAIRRALALLQLMRAAGLPFRVSEVHIERERGVTVFPVEPPVTLTFGWRRFPEKVARLATVLDHFAGREGQLGEVDLTLESQAVVRLRRPGRGRARAAGNGDEGMRG